MRLCQRTKNQTVYLVADDFGKPPGHGAKAITNAPTSKQAIVDLLDGQYSNLARVPSMVATVAGFAAGIGTTVTGRATSATLYQCYPTQAAGLLRLPDAVLC